MKRIKEKNINKFLLSKIVEAELASDITKSSLIYRELINTVQSENIKPFVRDNIIDLIVLLGYKTKYDEDVFKTDCKILSEIKEENKEDVIESIRKTHK